jgi:hypothetical protein
VDDSFRCRVFNRGPGESGDFRFEVDGSEAKLDRGKVYLRQGQVLIVPSPYGPSVKILLAESTEIDDGKPMPGAEIRAEGWMRDDGVVEADRVKTLCRAPIAIPQDDIPPEAEPVDPEATDI